jgi:phage baseplate assembly protein W
MNIQEGKHLRFPFGLGNDGRALTIDSIEEHLRDEIMQLILTNPGERLNLPEFGGGLRMLVFEGVDKTTEAMLNARLTQTINRWLGHRVVLEDLQVTIENSKIEVLIKYRLAGTENSRVLLFQRENK